MDEELDKKLDELQTRQWVLSLDGNQVLADLDNDFYIEIEIYGDDGDKKTWDDWIIPITAVWEVEENNYIETIFRVIKDEESIEEIKRKIVCDIAGQYKEESE